MNDPYDLKMLKRPSQHFLFLRDLIDRQHQIMVLEIKFGDDLLMRGIESNQEVSKLQPSNSWPPMTDAGHINNNFDDPLDEPFFVGKIKPKSNFAYFSRFYGLKILKTCLWVWLNRFHEGKNPKILCHVRAFNREETKKCSLVSHDILYLFKTRSYEFSKFRFFIFCIWLLLTNFTVESLLNMKLLLIKKIKSVKPFR